MITDKLIVGTANWGQKYGILSDSYHLSPFDLRMLIKQLKNFGVDTIDTSPLYGEAVEQIINYCDKEFRVYTKFLANTEDDTDLSYQKNRNAVIESINKFASFKIQGIYIHNVDVIFSKNFQRVVELLQKIKEKNNDLKIGISVYSQHEIEHIMKFWIPDMIQLPLNIFDQRLVRSGTLHELKQKSIEVHARSIFLQGILLYEHDELPNIFDRWSEYFNFFDHWCKIQKVSKLTACLSFVSNLSSVDKIVLGVNGSKQMLEILTTQLNFNLKDYDDLAVASDDELLDPRTWIKD